jgi:hypothetical protein
MHDNKIVSNRNPSRREQDMKLQALLTEAALDVAIPLTAGKKTSARSECPELGCSNLPIEAAHRRRDCMRQD